MSFSSFHSSSQKEKKSARCAISLILDKYRIHKIYFLKGRERVVVFFFFFWIRKIFVSKGSSTTYLIFKNMTLWRKNYCYIKYIYYRRNSFCKSTHKPFTMCKISPIQLSSALSHQRSSLYPYLFHHDTSKLLGDRKKEIDRILILDNIVSTVTVIRCWSPDITALSLALYVGSWVLHAKLQREKCQLL